jgi:hypothetical protein
LYGRNAFAYGAWMIPGSSGPNVARYSDLDAVSDTLPYDRPWNAPRNATMYCRPVLCRASFSAASTASVPLFVRNDRAEPPTGVNESSRSQTSE